VDLRDHCPVCKTTRLLRFCYRHCCAYLVEVNRQR
jgi:hypothetical protein